MKTTGHIERVGEVYKFIGFVNEATDFSAILDEKGPIKLSLETFAGMSSIGTRRFSDFVNAASVEGLELYDCPSTFVQLINIIPRLLGVPANSQIVRSFYLPFDCTGCDYRTIQLVRRHDVTVEGTDIAVPRVYCKYEPEHRVASAVDLHDYLLFMM